MLLDSSFFKIIVSLMLYVKAQLTYFFSFGIIIFYYQLFKKFLQDFLIMGYEKDYQLLRLRRPF